MDEHKVTDPVYKAEEKFRHARRMFAAVAFDFAALPESDEFNDLTHMMILLRDRYADYLCEVEERSGRKGVTTWAASLPATEK